MGLPTPSVPLWRIQSTVTIAGLGFSMSIIMGEADGGETNPMVIYS
jgi:hypothetical protein